MTGHVDRQTDRQGHSHEGREGQREKTWGQRESWNTHTDQKDLEWRAGPSIRHTPSGGGWETLKVGHGTHLKVEGHYVGTRSFHSTVPGIRIRAPGFVATYRLISRVLPMFSCPP